MLADLLYPFEAKLPECIGILLIIPAAEIGEMTLENLKEGVSSPREVLGFLLFQYGSILYTHIEYYYQNVSRASLKDKIEFGIFISKNQEDESMLMYLAGVTLMNLHPDPSLPLFPSIDPS